MPTEKQQHPRYHLRYQILPGAHVAEEARLLAAFCGAHRIEEVALFLAAEEWNDGLLSAGAEDVWFETVRTAKTILEEAGLQTSLNPWMTVLHCARGRRFPADRPFRPTISPLGETSLASASFADPAWQDYVYRLYGRFAELGFRVIWVEDDFRFHNHSPLTWGGGFEPEILARFARLIGRAVTREEVVARMLQPGAPHPWRAPWMQTWRDLHLEVAGGLAMSVARHAPGQTRLGLMSSHPAVHSTEGRDWPRLFDALSIEGRVAHRPHFAGYAEEPGENLQRSIFMLDVQRRLRPADCEVAPEIENFPFTAWTKSDRLTWAQMALCLFQGSDALLLDLFPFSGNRPGDDPAIGELLDRSRPALRWIGEAGFKALATDGVGVPWKQDAQAHVRTAAGQSLFELDATFHDAAHWLLMYGVPVTAQRRPVNAVFGRLMWAFDDREALELLAGGLLLDGESAAILCERGLARHLGVNFRGWAGREEADYAVETIVSDATGARPGLHLNANLAGRTARFDPADGAAEWTTLVNPKRERFGAGWIAFKNALGGRVVICAQPAPAQQPRSDHRQAIAQAAVRFAAGGRPDFPIVTGGPHLLPMLFRNAGRQILVVVNGSPDPARPVIHAIEAKPPTRATVLPPLAEVQSAHLKAGSQGLDRTLRLETDLTHLGFLAIEW
jgi:hypothetical protein